MPRKRPGIQGPGRERLRRNWEDIIGSEDQPPKEVAPTWLVGNYTEEQLQLKEDVAATNLAEKQFMETERVESLPDDPELYYQGPTKSTRVSRHRFVPERTGATGVIGTVYVEFTNMRKNGTIRRTNVYRYNKVPYPVYKSFTVAQSKGSHFATPNSKGPAGFKFDAIYSYERIDDPSVFND